MSFITQQYHLIYLRKSIVCACVFYFIFLLILLDDFGSQDQVISLIYIYISSDEIELYICREAAKPIKA